MSHLSGSPSGQLGELLLFLSSCSGLRDFFAATTTVKMPLRAGEGTQSLRTLAALPEDLNLGLSTHIK